MTPRLHADELHPSGGAELAAELGAASADHLAAPSDAGVDALAAAAATDQPVVATLLPATTWFLMKEHHAPARRFIERGVPVAIGTDFNPGHVADGQPAAGDDGRLPEPAHDAGRDAGGGHDQRGARAAARG